MDGERLIRLIPEGGEQLISIEQEAIRTGVSGTIDIDRNGNYDVANFERAEVAVPLPSGTTKITENGTHDVYDFAEAEVAVRQPEGEVVLTANGEHDVEWVKTAKVDVPKPTATTTITTNGTHDVTDYGTAEVAVPGYTLDQILRTELTDNDLTYNFANYRIFNPSVPLVFHLGDSVTSLYLSFATSAFSQSTQPFSIVISGGGGVSDMGSCFSGFRADSACTVDLTGVNFAEGGVNFSNCCGSGAQIQLKLPAVEATNLDSAFSINSYYIDSDTVQDYSMVDTTVCTTFAECFSSCYSFQGTLDLSGWSNTQGSPTSSLFRSFATNATSLIQTGERVCYIVIDSPQVFTLTDGGEFSGSAFERITDPLDSIGIFVPDSLVDEYKAATGWSSVAQHIKPLSERPTA